MRKPWTPKKTSAGCLLVLTDSEALLVNDRANLATVTCAPTAHDLYDALRMYVACFEKKDHLQHRADEDCFHCKAKAAIEAYQKAWNAAATVNATSPASRAWPTDASFTEATEEQTV